MTSLQRMRWSAAFCVAALTVWADAASASPAYVKSTVNLRAAPGTENEIVGKIPAGSLVDAGRCENGWCAVDWQGRSGYAISSALDTSGRVPAVQRRIARGTPPPAVYEGEEEIVGGPAYYAPPAVYYGYPYPYYRPFGYYRYRPYAAYRYGSWRRRW